MLSPDQVAYCRERDVPLGYDCAQNGWVPLDCHDDFEDTWDEPPQAHDLSRARQVQQSAATDDVERLDDRHLMLQKALSDSLDGELRSTSSRSGISAAAFDYRPWRESDADVYRRVFDDERVWAELVDEYPGPFDERLALHMIDLANLGDHHEVLAVGYRGQVVGQVRLIFSARNRDVRVAEVAYVLRPDLWGRGLMTPILADFTERSFKRHELDFIVAWIRPSHVASLRTAERAGYVRDVFPRERELAERAGRPGFVRYIRSRRGPQRVAPTGQAKRAS